MKSRLVWLLLCGIWGSTWLFIKVGLADLPPLTFAGLRFLIATAVLLLFVRARGVRLPAGRREWLLLAISGILAFTINYGLIFWGEQFISSGLAALLQATIPAFGLIIAHLYLPGERMTPTKIFGVVLGVIGVGLIFSHQLNLSGERALAGSVALVLSAASVAYANVLVKAYGKELEPAMLAAGQMLFGLVPLLVLGAVFEGNPLRQHWTWRAVVALFYLALVGSVVAFQLYYWLVRRMDVTKTMLIALVTPVVAVTLGILVLDEHLTARMLLGGLLIIGGIGLIVFRRPGRDAAVATTVAAAADEEEPEVVSTG
jgi:drug/metabolite transporter (DMT)-like permease